MKRWIDGSAAAALLIGLTIGLIAYPDHSAGLGVGLGLAAFLWICAWGIILGLVIAAGGLLVVLDAICGRH